MLEAGCLVRAHFVVLAPARAARALSVPRSWGWAVSWQTQRRRPRATGPSWASPTEVARSGPSAVNKQESKVAVAGRASVR